MKFFGAMFANTINAIYAKAEVQTELEQLKNLSNGDANEFARLVQEKYGNTINVYSKLNDSKNLKKIAGWVTFLGVVTLIGLIVGILVAVFG